MPLPAELRPPLGVALARPAASIPTADAMPWMAVAASKEAKALGLDLGKPWFELRPHAQRLDVAAVSSNYELYGDMSRRVMEVLERFTHELDVYSIDEAFLTVDRRTAADVDAMTRLGHDVKDTLRRLIGVPVCVGIAPTRTLAKLANRTAKKVYVFDGVCVWPATRPEWRRRLMEALPVSEVWGIAGRLERRLSGYGFRSIWDLATVDPVQVRKWFNVVMMRTALELRGGSLASAGKRIGRARRISSSCRDRSPRRSRRAPASVRLSRFMRSRPRRGWCVIHRWLVALTPSRARVTGPSRSTIRMCGSASPSPRPIRWNSRVQLTNCSSRSRTARATRAQDSCSRIYYRPVYLARWSRFGSLTRTQESLRSSTGCRRKPARMRSASATADSAPALHGR